MFLGAVGSGIWQYVLEPALQGSTNFMLELATLGIETYKNDLYIEISKGYQELASHRIQSLFNVMIAMIFISISAFLVKQVRFTVKDHEDFLNEIELIEQGQDKDRPSLAEIKSRLKAKNPKFLLKLAYLTASLSAVLAIMLTITTSSDTYVNSAVTHYYQMLRVASPYITQSEKLKIESEFAQVSSSEDFQEVIDKLYQATDSVGVEVTHFEVW